MIRALFAILLTACPAAAQAPRNCAETSKVASKLMEDFQEVPLLRGVNKQGVVQIWANLETGSWTATIMLPNGMTCMLSAGTDFEILSFSAPAGTQL